MPAIRFPPTSPAHKFTHAMVDDEPMFWHIGGDAWLRETAGAAEVALWLWFVGASVEAVERLERIADDSIH